MMTWYRKQKKSIYVARQEICIKRLGMPIKLFIKTWYRKRKNKKKTKRKNKTIKQDKKFWSCKVKKILFYFKLSTLENNPST